MYRFFVMLLLILILLTTCMGCTYMLAKETDKKEKIFIKQNKTKDKAREFYCSKVKDKEKCSND